MTAVSSRKGDYVPGPGVPKRSPQMVRDNKPARPGVAETVEQVPLRFAVPLLLGKAHAELFEIVSDPRDALEYGDLAEVLSALAETCGLECGAVAEAAADREGSVFDPGIDGAPEAFEFALLAGRLHAAIEAVALGLGDVERHAAALECLWSLAEAAGVEWEDVEELAADKRKRSGGFKEHMFWSAMP